MLPCLFGEGLRSSAIGTFAEEVVGVLEGTTGVGGGRNVEESDGSTVRALEGTLNDSEWVPLVLSSARTAGALSPLRRERFAVSIISTLNFRRAGGGFGVLEVSVVVEEAAEEEDAGVDPWSWW